MEQLLWLLVIGILLFSGAGLLAAQTFDKMKRTTNRTWLGVSLMIGGIAVNLIFVHTLLQSSL